MTSPYFMNFDPSPTKLRMFFGRRREIKSLLHYLSNGDSVLLVGERRVGKTFLLYMIGDLANRGVVSYERLLDKQTADVLAEVRTAVAAFRWLYVDLLSIDHAAGLYFNVLSGLGEESVQHFADLYPMDQATFIREVTRLSTDLSSKNQRAVVLVDECEKLFNLQNSAQILSVLKAVIQHCDSIDLVLAGDVRSHYETPDFVNLKTALRPIYLGPLEPADAIALVQVPVEGQLSFDEPVLQRILQLTGGRPGLVQILCDHLYETVGSQASMPHHVELPEFDQLWESSLRDRIFESFEPVLRDFFDGLQGDERNAVIFLAHNPRATENAVAEALTLQLASARRALRSLQVTRRLTRDGDGYLIGAKLVEEFGVRFVSLPDDRVDGAAEARVSEVSTLQEIIAGEEGADLEFKSSLRWDYHRGAVHKDIQDSAMKTVAAFQNSSGGTLVIGVNDEGKVLGLSKDYQTLKKKNRDGFQLSLMTLISDTLGKNACSQVKIGFYTLDGLDVCVVKVAGSPCVVFMGEESIVYIRTGNQTQRLNPKELVEYIKYHWSKP